MKKTIKIPNQTRLIEWLRFISDSRPKEPRFTNKDIIEFDLTKAEFLHPHHFTSLACVIQEYKNKGANIIILSKKYTTVGKFVKATKFNNYWKTGFNKDFCLTSELENTVPIWKYNEEKIDAYANLIVDFYTSHSFKGKDLTPLRLTIVEALNNIKDHSDSKIGGFAFTQYFPTTSELIISICDFGLGIPKNIQAYYLEKGLGKITEKDALQKALELGFTTRSMPHNAGRGLDTILSNVKTTKGELNIISNRAFFSHQITDGKHNVELDNLSLNFKGTCIKVKFKTDEFQDKEEELQEEMLLI